MNSQCFTKYLKKEGNIDIFPQIQDGNAISIAIIGDPDGLRYLASLFIKLAPKQASYFKFQCNRVDDFIRTQLFRPSRLAG